MNNPFASFLQPQFRTLEGAPSFGEIESIGRGRRQDAQRAIENTQQHALAQRGATRADSQLKLQQDDQAHRFTAEEQKQVEGLLAEYQDAEDQGDQVRLSRASQMLKRFGMDVGPKGMDPRAAAFTGSAKPNLQALSGQKPPPLPGQLLPNVEAFTGKQPDPIGDAVSTELASREALRARNGQEAPDLSQEDFESQLINGSPPVHSRYEEGGKTTDEFKATLPQSPDEPEDLGDVDDPAFKAAAAAEVIDLDKEDPAPLQIGQLPKVATAEAPQVAAAGPQTPPRLPGQLLPTVISKGGKQLYESTGPSGRWTPMVSGVFEPFAQHENPEMASAAKRAQAMSSSLIAVDGYAPKDAIKAGMDYLQGEANRISQTERTKIGSQRRGGGGAAGALTSGISFKADGTLNDDLDKVRTMFVNSDQYKNVVQKRLLVEGAVGQLQSGNGMSQQEAVSTLRRIQSGLTLNAFETQEFNNAAGAIEGIYNKFNKLAGDGQLSPEYKRQLQEVYARITQTLDSHTERLAQGAYDYWMGSRKRSGPAEIIEEKGQTLKDSLGNKSAPKDPNENLYK